MNSHVSEFSLGSLSRDGDLVNLRPARFRIMTCEIAASQNNRFLNVRRFAENFVIPSLEGH